MTTTNVLVTGANRGLGLALAASYALRTDTTLIAAVRDPTHAISEALKTLPTSKNSTVHVVQIRSDSRTDAKAAVAHLEKLGITHLDLVVANAGILGGFPLVHEADPEEMLRHYNVNTVGKMVLFQAVRALLLAAVDKGRVAKFVAMSSSVSSIANMEQVPFPNGIYAPSKTALNWFLRKIHLENESIVAFPLHPGWVQTDMGNGCAANFNYGGGKAPTAIEDSRVGMLKVIDDATRDKYSGQLVDFEGNILPW